MKHPGVATILATGGPGMVKAAYSSASPPSASARNAPAVTARYRMWTSNVRRTT